MVLIMKVGLACFHLDFIWLKVVLLQLTAFCWNVHDGRLPQKGLADFQRERALPQLPSLLDYAGYVVGAICSNIVDLDLINRSSSFPHCLLVLHSILLTIAAGSKPACLTFLQGLIHQRYRRLGKNEKYPAVAPQP